MSRGLQHLQCRDGMWHFRMRVPAELRPVVGKREIKRSLRTRDQKDAKRLLPLEMLKARAALDEARRKLAIAERPPHVAEPSPALQASLGEDELWGLMSRWFVRTQQQDGTLTAADIDQRVLDEELTYVLDWDHAEPSTRQAARKLLDDQGINLSPTSPDFRRLQELIQEANVERQKRLLARFSARSDLALNPALAALTVRSEIAEVRPVTLAQLIERFSTEPSQVALAPKTAAKREAQYRLFKDYFGATTRVDRIDRDQMRSFRDDLGRLPANAKQRFPKLSVRKLLELSEEKRKPLLSPATVNAYLAALTTLFQYALREGHVKADLTARLLVRDNVRPEDKRLPFEADDLKAIFSGPLYVGCVDDGDGYAQPGPNRPRRGRFWVPLIALFSGLRLGEVCQLTEDDIIVIGEHTLIRVTDTPDRTKSLKTPSARRNVPVHDELIKLGFLDYVTDIRAAHPPGTRLFPELTLASTGYASDNFSKWFARFLDGRGIKDRRKAFHSFRHAFRDRLRAAGVPEERAQALGGWAGQGTDKAYGQSPVVLAAILSEEMAKVSYPELDLSSLYPPR